MERALLSTLASQVAVAIAGTDASGRITYCSPTLLALLELDHEPTTDVEFAILPLYQEDHVTRLTVDDLPLVRARHGEMVRDHVMVVGNSDKGVRFVRSNASPIFPPEGGDVCGAVCLMQDVTNEYGANLREAHLRNRLIASVNHQLRTPLSLALGHSELLLDMDLPAPARRSATVLHDAMAALADLVDQVSKLVDIESAGDLTVNYGDLIPPLEQLVKEVTPSAAERGIRMDFLGPRSLSVTADIGQLRRAVDALVCNAIQYAPDHSTVTVRVARRQEAIRIGVSDEGDGIPPADRVRVVQPFEVADHPRRLIDSRGLGLAVANSIVTAHGGHLEMHDTKPHGLSALLILPRYGAIPRPAPGPDQGPRFNGPSTVGALPA